MSEIYQPERTIAITVAISALGIVRSGDLVSPAGTVLFSNPTNA